MNYFLIYFALGMIVTLVDYQRSSDDAKKELKDLCQDFERNYGMGMLFVTMIIANVVWLPSMIIGKLK